MSTPDKVWLRRGEARAALGVSHEVFRKLVAGGVLTPKYFPGGTRAFFERTEVERVQPKAKTPEFTAKTQRGEGAKKN